MEIDDETLEICKRLPEHEWEVGDWGYHIEAKVYFNVLTVDDISINTQLYHYHFDKLLATRGELNRYLTELFYIGREKLVFIPSVEDLMSLDEWPDDWVVRKVNDNYQVISLKNRGKFVDAKGCAFTARLACLRAIRPILEEK